MTKPYQIGVIGAGNIGTAMAALCSQSDADVWLTARGARLEQISADGIELADRGNVISATPKAVERIPAPVDALFVCVKSQHLGQALQMNKAAITPDTLVIPMVNGLPFWFYADDAGFGDTSILDPKGDLATLLTPKQVLGAVLLMTVQTDATGQAQSSNTPTLSLGAVCDGTDQQKIEALIALLEHCGVRTDCHPAIREKVLVKLLANFATNPLSAVTGAMLDDIGKTPALCNIATALAGEFRTWAKTEGYALPPDVWLTDLLIDAGAFPTSMLQDALAGKQLELDAICRAPMIFAQSKGCDMPVLRALLDLIESCDQIPLSKDQLPEALKSLRQPALTS